MPYKCFDRAQRAIFDDLKTDIQKDFPFLISENNLEVISGKMEGVYAWIAVNFALRRFDHGEQGTYRELLRI